MLFRRRVWILLAAAHLVVVVCGAANRLPSSEGGGPTQLIGWYASISGADSQYGFFAPEVGSPYRARFVLQDDRGAVWCDAQEQGASPEAELRLGGTVDH